MPRCMDSSAGWSHATFRSQGSRRSLSRLRAGRADGQPARSRTTAICRSKISVDAFEWLGAARESQSGTVRGRPLVGHVRGRADARACRSPRTLAGRRGRHQSPRVAERVWRRSADVRGERIRIDGVETRVAGVAPDWLEGLYLGRAVDIWMPLREASLQGIDRSSRTLLGARAAAPGRVNRSGAGRRERDARSGADVIAVLPYTRDDAGSGGRHVAHRHAAAAPRPARCSSSRAPTSPRSCCRGRPPARTRHLFASRSAPAAANSPDSCSRTASSSR